MPKLEKQVAIITGAGSGIGRATALLFAREGAQVVVADYNLEAAQETVDLIDRLDLVSLPAGTRAAAGRVNVAVAAEAEALVNFAVDTFGNIDILVNNAGVGVAGTVLSTAEEDWDRIFAVNVKGIYQCSRYAIPEMIKQGGG